MTSVSVLDEGWRLRGFLGDDWQLHRAQLHARETRDDEHYWVPARVPGTVLADLLAAGRVPDPYVGTQSVLSEWVPQRTWVYRTRLRAPGLEAGQRAFLEFDGIDYSATVHLDGERIAAHEGTFVPLVLEVTERLDSGEHSLAVVVDPAPVSEPQVGHTSAVTVHKGRMGYGWDFCPRLVHQGLWGPARLRVTGPLRLADVWARPVVTDTSGRLTVMLQVDGEPEQVAEPVRPHRAVERVGGHPVPAQDVDGVAADGQPVRQRARRALVDEADVTEAEPQPAFVADPPGMAHGHLKGVDVRLAEAVRPPAPGR
ncbi:MAG: glycosyl hydrolase 2 galactose-binding domain-containing protein, partial [Actinoallomurus sp.]